jgi:hypothetical protein
MHTSKLMVQVPHSLKNLLREWRWVWNWFAISKHLRSKIRIVLFCNDRTRTVAEQAKLCKAQNDKPEQSSIGSNQHLPTSITLLREKNPSKLLKILKVHTPMSNDKVTHSLNWVVHMVLDLVHLHLSFVICYSNWLVGRRPVVQSPSSSNWTGLLMLDSFADMETSYGFIVQWIVNCVGPIPSSALKGKRWTLTNKPTNHKRKSLSLIADQNEASIHISTLHDLHSLPWGFVSSGQYIFQPQRWRVSHGIWEWD